MRFQPAKWEIINWHKCHNLYKEGFGNCAFSLLLFLVWELMI